MSSSSLERLQFDEMRERIRTQYFDTCKSDPTAAARFGDCLRLLCSGTPDAMDRAWERLARDDDHYREAEKMLKQLGPQASFADLYKAMDGGNTAQRVGSNPIEGDDEER